MSEVHGLCYSDRALPPSKLMQQSLSQNEVRCIYQDRDGLVWIGTQDGLNSFNGYEYKKYGRTPFAKESLSSDVVNAMGEVGHESLLIGTNKGLDVFNLKTEEFANVSQWLNAEGVDEWVTSIYNVSESRLLVTSLNGAFEIVVTDQNWPLKANVKSITKAQGNRKIYEGIVDRKGIVWLATSEGLCEIDPASGIEKMLIPNGRKDFVCSSLKMDKNGNIWVLANKNLYYYESNLKSFVNNSMWKALSGITAINIDRYGDIWLGTNGNGLYKCWMDHNEMKEIEAIIGNDNFNLPNLSGVDIHNIYEGDQKEEDVIWIGTLENGLLQYSRSKNSFLHYHQLVSSQYKDITSYYSLLAENDVLWAGSENGLMKINIKERKVIRYMADKGNDRKNQYQEIFRDRDQKMWIGSNEGLFQINESTGLLKEIKIPFNQRGKYPAIFEMVETKTGDKWIGTSAYLLHVKKGHQTKMDSVVIAGKSESIGAVGALLIDSKERLWIGTTKGLLIYSEDQFTKFTYDANNKSGLLEDVILDIYQSSFGDIYIASSKGLSKVEERDGHVTFQHYAETEGLSNSYVYGILEDSNGKLWLSTNKGISSFDPIAQHFHNYSAMDGLGHDEFNSGAYCKSESGVLYFGGLNVLLGFNPKLLKSNLHVPILKMVSAKLDGEYLDQTIFNEDHPIIKVPYGKSILSLVFASLDFTNSSKNQYAYRISGIDDEWQSNGYNREINLIHLPYGTYELEVKSSNNEGIWNEGNTLHLTLDMIPPFWRTAWFICLCVLSLLFLLYSFYKIRVRQKLALQKARLEENERVRTMASQDMHDEFGNSLTRITILTELVRSKINQNKNEEANTLLLTIAENTERLYQNTKDFIWAIRTDSDQLFETMVRIKDFAEDVLAPKNIDFKNQGLVDGMQHYELPKGASRQVVMIMKEAITNTLKHSKATSTQLVTEIEGQTFFRIEWKDNGMGIPEGRFEKGNGINNMRNRAKAFGGSLHIFRNDFNETVIQLEIPLLASKKVNKI